MLQMYAIDVFFCKQIIIYLYHYIIYSAIQCINVVHVACSYKLYCLKVNEQK